jgi:hypothetical protein
MWHRWPARSLIALAVVSWVALALSQAVVTVVEALAAEKYLGLTVSVPPDLPPGRRHPAAPAGAAERGAATGGGMSHSALWLKMPRHQCRQSLLLVALLSPVPRLCPAQQVSGQRFYPAGAVIAHTARRDRGPGRPVKGRQVDLREPAAGTRSRAPSAWVVSTCATFPWSSHTGSRPSSRLTASL